MTGKISLEKNERKRTTAPGVRLVRCRLAIEVLGNEFSLV
jgi:hypothetical protein